MPYIPEHARSTLTEFGGDPRSPGELNYILTLELIGYADRHGLSYQTINDILGALEGAKLEFYRRVVAPYEDKKIQAHGDVY